MAILGLAQTSSPNNDKNGDFRPKICSLCNYIMMEYMDKNPIWCHLCCSFQLFEEEYPFSISSSIIEKMPKMYQNWKP